jgi:hypothetical protein
MFGVMVKYKIEFKSDKFLGVMIWELFYCEEPYIGIDPITVAYTLREKGSFLTKLPIFAPKKLKKIFQQTQKFNPKERPTFANIESMLKEIKG